LAVNYRQIISISINLKAKQREWIAYPAAPVDFWKFPHSPPYRRDEHSRPGSTSLFADHGAAGGLAADHSAPVIGRIGKVEISEISPSPGR
jgi:hypothetical protein